MAVLRRASVFTYILACSVAVQACEVRDPLDITLTEDQAAVMSVLSAGDSIARVLLTIIPGTYDPLNPSAELNWIPIGDAHVRLVAGADTITLSSQRGAASNACLTDPAYETSPARWLLPGCYVGMVPGGIRPGASYGLVADLPGRGRIEGRTTVPAEPVILQPAAGAAIDTWTSGGPQSEPTKVQWSGVAEDRMLELRVRSGDEECRVSLTPGFVHWVPITNSNSAEIIVQMGCPSERTEAAGDIILTAFDSTYSRYLPVIGDHHQQSEAAAGFTGPAIGVFGSAATVRHPVRFVRD
ncbi:MAG TPA: hypothetical protein VHG09_10650 [Longimicrobiales bacterium]|nr:hypothetical protein [Longimicrobiales bacterium]